ncbi:MAG TPA: penicillin-binding protein 2 [Azospirillaceae bacterium]|nr:penicillin-binding protein 2 [Azospirillaceae bacterium]
MLSAIDRDAERQRVMSRRTMVLGGMKAAALTAFAARLYYLQIVEGDRYTTLAEDNRISLRLIAPTRGLIVDRQGVPLALNEQNFRAILVSERAGNVSQILAQMQSILPMSEQDHRRIMRDIQRSRSFAPVTIRENLTWDQVSAIEVNLPDLPGLAIEVGQVRAYPFGEATAHFLGYVGAVSEADQAKSEDPLLSLPGFRVGKNGLEKRHDDVLRGTAGSTQLEVNAFGRVIRELSRDEGKPGSQVTLTIDAKLQHFAQQRLAPERSAAAVVLDVDTGGIVALASNPSFDPNQFAMGISSELYESLIKDETNPLINKVIAGQYSPGSTFKVISALSFLENGIDANQRVHCSGKYNLGGHPFHCWKKGGHGAMDMKQAIMHSCDVYFYEMSRRVGIDKIAETARRFGMGEKTEIELPGERAGLVPDTKWKRQALKQPWHPGETLIASMGQGYVLSTPLQLAVMTARLANGGRAVKPHLTKSVDETLLEPPEWPAIQVNQENLRFILDSMAAVVNEPGGTALRSRITKAGYEMGGKTGTSQVRRISLAERSTGVKKNEDLPWRQRDHALFIAYAPVHKPKYACAVVVEHGGGGSTVAAPIARDILLELQMLDAARASVAELPPEPPADAPAAASPAPQSAAPASPAAPAPGVAR